MNTTNVSLMNSFMKTASIHSLTDDNRLIGAKNHFGHDIPTYDDGYGTLFIMRDSMGISGIVRARSWEDAYSICEDEFFPEATETVEELKKEYNFKREHIAIIKRDGIERDAKPEDFPLTNEFVRWALRETPEEDAWIDNALFQEAFGFRPNGPRTKDVLKHGIYAKDLNGERLDVLTTQLLNELEITLQVEQD